MVTRREYIDERIGEKYRESLIDTLQFAHYYESQNTPEKKIFDIRYPNSYDDMYRHWDVQITKILAWGENGEPCKWGKLYKVDVKGMKFGFRGLPEDLRCVLLEVQNVRGSTGWMYGDSRGIVFEDDTDFFHIPTNILRNVIRKKFVNWDSDKREVIDYSKVNIRQVDAPYLHRYELCGRKEMWNRDDIFGYVPYTDIKDFITKRIPKTISREEINDMIEATIVENEEVSNI